ncbi:MAG: DNA-directed RNA polymerase subunit omega [Spirochaetales bacterium]|nr:DNA-directed RNA polymerase subunit omega [Spirochaetales bacterium]
MGRKNNIGDSDRVLPLDLLVSYEGNMYELTCAAIKRAAQINLAGDIQLEESFGRVVSLAIKQILTKKVEYRLEE